jgi:hypothetical protein
MYSVLVQATLLACSLPFVSAEWPARRQLNPRDDSLSFCYGTNSICSAAVSLHDACDAFDNQKDETQKYQCLCGNGYVSTDLAYVALLSRTHYLFLGLIINSCGWCDIGFDPTRGHTVDTLHSIYLSECSSASATIAPIPASAIAAYSSHNATFTGTVPGVTGLGKSAKSTSGQTGTTSKNGASKTSSAGVVTQTLFGGGAGGDTATTTAGTLTSGAASPATSTATVKSGAATVGVQQPTSRVFSLLCVVVVGAVIMW